MNTKLGKYTSFNTLLHRMDARVKLITMIIFMVSVFLDYGTTYMNLVVDLFLFLILVILCIIGKVSVGTIFRALKAIWLMIFIILVINVFFPATKTGDIAFSINNFPVYWSSIMNVIFIFARLVLVLMMTNIFTCVTKPLELTNALEFLLFPLSLIRIPIHKFAMALSLALRFVPTLQEEADRIIKAQASRGVDYKQGKIKDKVKSIVSLIIPLFVSAFTSSGQLADAMEARGYDPNAKRTKYKTTHWSIVDTISLFLAASFLTGAILLAIFPYDLFSALQITLPKLK